jgi:hypothetical protein
MTAALRLSPAALHHLRLGVLGASALVGSLNVASLVQVGFGAGPHLFLSPPLATLHNV